MAVKYIKKAAKTPETDDHKTQAAVQDILNDIAKRKEVALRELNKKFDKYDGEVIVSKAVSYTHLTLPTNREV